MLFLLSSLLKFIYNCNKLPKNETEFWTNLTIKSIIRTNIHQYFQGQKKIVQHNNKLTVQSINSNDGICAAKGKYIAFLDADNAWLPTKLYYQMIFAEL